MKYLSLTIPGTNGTPMQIDSGLPTGVPTGGIATTGNRTITVFLELVLVGAILFSLYSLIRGGINMISSGGHKEKFQIGRERVRYAIIGLIVVFMSFFLINVIGKIFGVNLLSSN